MRNNNPQWYRERFPFEYCAARYLEQWESDELALCLAFEQALSSGAPPSNDIMKHALTYFRIARNFRGITDNYSEVWQALADEATAHRQRERSDTSENAVARVEKAWQTAGFASRKISAASKLLWITFKRPFIIYDSQAARALTRAYASHPRIEGDYARYTEAWRIEYESVSNLIGAATRQLPHGRQFMSKPRTSDDEIIAFADCEWFRERVFDTFLWMVGSEYEKLQASDSKRRKLDRAN